MSPASVAARIAVLAVAIAAGIFFAHLRESEPGPPSSLRDAYALMTGAMSQPGMVLHVRVTYPKEEGVVCGSTLELWIEEGGRRVRSEPRSECPGEVGEPQNRRLNVEGGWYFVDVRGPQSGVSPPCRDTDLPGITLLLECGGDREVSVQVRSGVRIASGDAVQIRSTGELQGIDSRVTLDSSLYLDPLTGLPLEMQTTTFDYYGVDDSGEPTEWKSWRDYTTTYVERSSLPEDFFEPAAIGVTSTYPVEIIEREVMGVDMRPYWIGESVPASAPLPGLKLKEHSVFDFDEGDSLSLGYRLADTEFGRSVVQVSTFAADNFTSPSLVEGVGFSEPCSNVEEIDLPGAEAAVIVAAGQGDVCTGLPYSFVAVADYGSSRVHVMVWATDLGTGRANPYATRNAAIELLRALKPLE